MMNPLIEYGVAYALGRLQKPAGKSLIAVGQGLQAVGQDLETLGHALVDTAPSAPPRFSRVGTGKSKAKTPGWRSHATT